MATHLIIKYSIYYQLYSTSQILIFSESALGFLSKSTQRKKTRPMGRRDSPFPYLLLPSSFLPPPLLFFFFFCFFVFLFFCFFGFSDQFSCSNHPFAYAMLSLPVLHCVAPLFAFLTSAIIVVCQFLFCFLLLVLFVFFNKGLVSS